MSLLRHFNMLNVMELSNIKPKIISVYIPKMHWKFNDLQTCTDMYACRLGQIFFFFFFDFLVCVFLICACIKYLPLPQHFCFKYYFLKNFRSSYLSSHIECHLTLLIVLTEICISAFNFSERNIFFFTFISCINNLHKLLSKQNQRAFYRLPMRRNAFIWLYCC